MRSRARKPPPIPPPEMIEDVFEEEGLSGRLRELESQLEDMNDTLAEERRASESARRDLARHVEFPISYEVGTMLDKFVATGFFGKDRDEAAGILMRERLRDLAWPQIFNPSVMGRAFLMPNPCLQQVPFPPPQYPMQQQQQPAGPPYPMPPIPPMPPPPYPEQPKRAGRRTRKR